MDLLEIDSKLWAPMLRQVIAAQQPRMIGIHLRQGDTLCNSDYDYVSRRSPGGPPHLWSYFPVEDTLKLIQVLRGLTRAPITMGGFGFTANSRRLMAFLEPDYGVQGCPDGFFARFEDVLAGRELTTVPGLIHRQAGGYRENERGYYNPASGLEYTDEILDELTRFYGQTHLLGPSAPTIAVEVMRGCPFRCYFCAEPDVKGRRMAYRDLDVVEEEVRRLRRRHLRRFWFVCSELNIQGPEFALRLAERVIRLNQEFPEQPMEWTGYALPTMTPSDLRTLQRSGYVGALNDVLSLDDENLKAAGVPYRAKHAIGYLRGLLAATAATANEDTGEAPPVPVVNDARSWYAAQAAKKHTGILSLFLGNAHANEKTLYTSLQRIDDEGLQEHYEEGAVIPATRVFDVSGTKAWVEDRELVSFQRTGERPANLVWPTFLYPKFLVQRLGSLDSIMEFFSFVSDTFLSTAHRRKKDWNWFLANHTTTSALRGFAEYAFQMDKAVALDSSAYPEVRRLVDRVKGGELADDAFGRALFSPLPAEKEAWNRAARIVLEHIFRVSPDCRSTILVALGLPDYQGTAIPISEYKMMRTLYARYDSLGELRAQVLTRVGAAKDSLAALFLEYLLYAHNIIVRPEYRGLLFAPQVEPS